MAILKKAIAKFKPDQILTYWNGLGRKEKGWIKRRIMKAVNCSKVPFYNAFKSLNKLKDLHSLIEFDILYILNELATFGKSQIINNA